ncbi:putative E3 ubiquitin-protein ligase LIN-1 isoform X1 [Zingiber officinale]|uniref:putative E3 ubiquitin-protein ligase LIN-1 isoform X1 n=1 Tax=Zingiber officinale TaxID=94328 RepID=UPI001C4AB6DD|nr:putative E3 ubiquitin-protein ligase LIN-1 isoform X1 [Zingiber officinale]
MAASLRELLAQESSQLYSNRSKSTSSPLVSARRRSFDRPRRCAGQRSEPSNSNSRSTTVSAAGYDDDDPVVDEAALCGVVSVLSGYAGRFLKDADFRRRLRDKCAACIVTARKGAATHAVLTNLEMGIESIERLAEEGPYIGGAGDSKIRSLRNSIRLLSVVASLNSPRSRAGLYTCGVPNAHLSACAQLYLAVVYKIERNDRVSAKHLLQVFVDAPYLARKNLLPDLWDHFLLPHLLHLKVWYTKEVELVASWEAADREQKMKSLNMTYNDQMDAGTAQFAVYYRDWIKVDGKAPPIPTVSLPPRPSYLEPWGKRSLSLSRSSINKNLYQAVFGLSLEREETGDGILIDDAKLVSETQLAADSDSTDRGNGVHVSQCGFSRQNDVGVRQRETDKVQENLISRAELIPRKSHSFRLFSCRSVPDAATVHHVPTPKKEFAVVAQKTDNNMQPLNLSKAIGLISESDNLKECEVAIHIIAKAWRDSHRDATLVTALSTSSVIEGFLEVNFTSTDDDVLELSISILAELVARNDVNRQIVLHADPQLEIFLRLLRSKNIFLKAAVVLYLLRPKAKQMLSVDWIPLVLRVMDHGDASQSLFAIKCHPRTAAFYLLDQLLTGFDVDRNVENSKQLVALGGLDLLMRRLEIGDSHETHCASILARCVRADGSCREYLAENINKASIVQLLLCNQMKSNSSAITLLSEMVCLNRTTQIITFLKEFRNAGYMNAMHVLLVYLQQAPNEQRPLAAALLLQLDQLGDPLRHSMYREDAVDALITALEHNLHNRKIQEKCSRALLLLAGRFSHSGEDTAEAWLLRRAGLQDSFSDSFRSREIFLDETVRPEEEEKATEEWLRKLAITLLTSGNKRFLVALSNCISEGIPSLSRSCLVTVAWMSSSLASWQNANHLLFHACSTLAPRLFESLSYHKAQEERVLASLSLFNFVRYPECLPMLFPLDKETVCSLQDLSQVTWTAKELLFASCR